MAAEVLNDWVGYLDRSYQQIKTAVLLRVTNSNPEMTDHSESNPFVILVSIFAAIAEMLGYYIDAAAREAFIGTALQRSSIIKHTFKLDYRIKARYPESVEVVITWTDGAGTPRNTLSQFTLQEGSTIESTDGIIYVLPSDTVIPIDTATSQLTFEQYSEVTGQVLGTSDNSENQEYALTNTYRQSSLQITINGVVWTEVITFANSVNTDKHFLVDIKEDDIAYVRFGDGINGAIPDNTFNIVADYQTTNGPDGSIQADTLTNNVTLLGLPINHDATTNNPDDSSGGANFEDTNTLVKNAINSIRVLERAVTPEDFKYLLESFAGIGKAAVNFCCGKTIDLYIVPTGGGIATTQLITDSQNYIDDRKMVTTFPVVKAAGESVIKIQATIYAKKRANLSTVGTAVDAALLEYGNVDNRNINGNIRISDIQALIDNIANVDFVDLDFIYILPYARPDGHTNVLSWVNETTNLSTAKVNWRLQYDLTNNEMRVYREGAYKGNLAVDTEYVAEDGIFKFTWSAGSYADNDEWTFTSYPYNTNISISDYSIPTTKVADINTIIKAYTESTNDNC